MAYTGAPPFFSVILPTRNRPRLFERALQSVLAQNIDDIEIIVVVDGSDQDNLAAYRALETAHPRIKFHYLMQRASGHGQSYAINQGFGHSNGDYLCFLDDDDCWTDPNYLTSVFDNVTSSRVPVDIHYSNQVAFYADGSEKKEPLWIADLASKVNEDWRIRDHCYRVTPEFLLTSAGFAHMNCSIFRRDFFERLGGMDESIRYENDRDVFLRSIDRAECILYYTNSVSRHNIPDPRKQLNMSTASSAIERKLYQLRVYDKGSCESSNKAVVSFCRNGKAIELKRVTQLLSENGRLSTAACYARQALACTFSVRWLLYTVYLGVLAIFRGDRPVN
jgi:glycosyltransferase involved in cell wall biosynthesis